MSLKERLEVFNSKANEVKEKLKEFSKDNMSLLREFIVKKPYPEQNEKNADKDINLSLVNAKKELALIKKKLQAWNLIINYDTIQRKNEKDTTLIDSSKNIEFLVAILCTAIDKKFSELIGQILGEFDNINTSIKEKGYWLTKSKINKPSLVNKILHRGYFNIDFSIKKIKAKLVEALSFNQITNFILKHSFWTLLTYGIVCWPWIDKVVFAQSWAEQLGLPEAINEAKKLRIKLLNNNVDDLLRKIIILINDFLPYKSQAIVQIVNDFKNYVVVKLDKSETLEQKIEDLLGEKNYFSYVDSSTSIFFNKGALSSSLANTAPYSETMLLENRK